MVEPGGRAGWDRRENPRSLCGVRKFPLVLNPLYDKKYGLSQ
jgi:hypothetical protein